MRFTKRSFINSVLTQQKLMQLANSKLQKLVNIVFQQSLEDQEILNLIDAISSFQLKSIIFYKLFTLEIQSQYVESVYNLTLEEEITQQLVEKLFSQFKIRSFHSNIKRTIDYSDLLNQKNLFSFKQHVYKNYNILSLEQIKQFMQIAISHPNLKEIYVQNSLDYLKDNHLKISSKLLESDPLQELVNILTYLNSNARIEIFITCNDEQRFSYQANDYQLLNNLISTSQQFQKEFHLKINQNFIFKKEQSSIEINNKIDSLFLNQLNLPKMKSMKIYTSESDAQKLNEFFKKLMEQNFKLESIQLVIQKKSSYYFFDSLKSNEQKIEILQLLQYVQVQNLQSIKYLSIQETENGKQLCFDLKKSLLLVKIDKNVQNNERVLQFLQNLISFQQNQFSSIKYYGSSQFLDQHFQIISKLKELSANQLIDLDIQQFLQIDLQEKTIRIQKLKKYEEVIQILTSNLSSVQQTERLVISKKTLKPKKNTLEKMINFFLQNQSKIKSVDLSSSEFIFDIQQHLSIIQILVENQIPKFTISKYTQKYLEFNLETKTIHNQLFNNNKYFKQFFSYFNKIHLKINDIVEKENEEILNLINQNVNLKELILNVNKFDQVDLISKLKFKFSQLENLLVQGNNIKIFFEKSTKTFKLEADSTQAIQYFLMNSTSQDQNLFFNIEQIELIDLSQNQNNSNNINSDKLYQSFNYFLIKPFQIKSLKLQTWQYLGSFLELIEHLSNLNLQNLNLQLNIQIDEKAISEEGEKIQMAITNFLEKQKVKKYTFTLKIFENNQIAGEIIYNQDRSMVINLKNLLQFLKSTKYDQNGTINILSYFVKGFKFTKKLCIYNSHEKSKVVIKLLQSFYKDLPLVTRLFVKSSHDDQYFAQVNQSLKFKSILLNLIQLSKIKKANHGFNRAEKFLDLLEFYKIPQNQSILSQDLIWDYQRILKTF